MRRFLRKRWHGIPVGILAVLLLVGVAAASTYTIVSMQFSVTVTEPITVWRSWTGADPWIRFEEGSVVPLVWDAGNTKDMWVKVTNTSNNAITVTMYYDDHDGTFELTGSDLVGTGISCASGGADTLRMLTWKVADGAGAGTYLVAVNFTRG